MWKSQAWIWKSQDWHRKVFQCLQSTLLKAKIQDKLKRGIVYHATPPPYNNNYIPPTSNLLKRQENEELPIGASDVDPLNKMTVETDDFEDDETEVRNKETIPLENHIITNENGGKKFIRSRKVEIPRNEKNFVLPKNREKVEQPRKEKKKVQGIHYMQTTVVNPCTYQ